MRRKLQIYARGFGDILSAVIAFTKFLHALYLFLNFMHRVQNRHAVGRLNFIFFVFTAFQGLLLVSETAFVSWLLRCWKERAWKPIKPVTNYDVPSDFNRNSLIISLLS